MEPRPWQKPLSDEAIEELAAKFRRLDEMLKWLDIRIHGERKVVEP